MKPWFSIRSMCSFLGLIEWVICNIILGDGIKYPLPTYGHDQNDSH